jgi:hypothetical protein
MDTFLLATKLRIPPEPNALVRRARLVDALEQGIPQHKLILLSAPAGYGKTTLLSQWALASQYFVAWLSVGEADNALDRFLRYLLAGWETVQPAVRKSPLVPVQLAVEGGAGPCLGQINPLTRTLEYERVPAALRARVFGTITAGAMVGTPLGGLLSGVCAAALGAQATLLVFGAVYLLATVSLLVNPALKGMERKEQEGTQDRRDR